MIEKNPEATVKDLVETFVKYQTLHRDTIRRDDVPTANRHMPKVHKALTELSQSAEGRKAIEALMTHPMAFIRLRAAGRVLAWAPDAAIPVLGRLLTDNLKDECPIDERIEIRLEAKGWLYGHFGIKHIAQNKLIEPLRAYGIELPWRPEDGSF